MAFTQVLPTIYEPELLSFLRGMKTFSQVLPTIYEGERVRDFAQVQANAARTVRLPTIYETETVGEQAVSALSPAPILVDAPSVGAFSLANLTFSTCSDLQGARYTSEILAVSGDPTWFGLADWDGYATLLYSRNGAVYCRRTQKPEDAAAWSAASEWVVGISGRVYGLAMNEAGVLLGLVDNKPVVSFDGGQTWVIRNALPVDSIRKRVVAQQADSFLVAWPEDTTVRHLVTLDAGVSWK